MCGICGQFNYDDTSEPVDQARVRASTRTLSHRGPDDEGFFFSGSLGLGFRRLSIIDLGGGHQPMADSEKTVYVVFNGEIYNYRELRTELQAFGHRFHTQSDTEVIIHGYKQWGEDVFGHLNGMFGVAVWDVGEQRLTVARDAMGIKPVYYQLQSGVLSFGSEIRAVAGLGHDSEIDPVSIALFLQYRFVPSPFTLFKDIRKLAPGTSLVAHRGKVEIKRWYQFTPTPFKASKTLADAKAELTSLYRAAMKRHLISDVPVGLLLSGGIDSGLLLALMAEHGNAWPTYSVGYGSTFRDDELVDAEATATTFKSSHTSLALTADVFDRLLPQVVASLEEPVATSSIVPMFAICARARQDVKVALIGQGPDELFGGYTRHLGVHYGRLWRGTPTMIRRGLAPLLSAVPRAATLQRGLYALDVDDRFDRFRNILSIAPSMTINGLFRDDLGDQSVNERIRECWADFVPQFDATDELGAFQLLEVRSTLPDELLMYADKLSMAHGLEVRVPYLDREVVEYAQCLPASMKVSLGQRKRLHRAVCADFLPREALKRKKRGFAANVVDDWFRRSISSGIESSLLDRSSLIYRYLEPSTVAALFREHQSGKRDNHKLLFSLVVLENWLRLSNPLTPVTAPAAALLAVQH